MLTGKEANLAGHTFGYLFVVGEAITRTKHKTRLWICTCRCGNEILLTTYLLTGKRKQKSCGCYWDDIMKDPPAMASMKRVYRQYIRHAEERKLKFDLTLDQFKELTSKNCYYCDTEPRQSMISNIHNGHYVYNGIDRVDNNLGYIFDNCVTCCKQCNWAKKNLSIEDFTSWVRAVYTKQCKNKELLCLV